MQLIAHHLDRARKGPPGQEPVEWELHLVAHSAGSVFAAYAMRLLSGLGIPLKTVQFMAPAIRTDVFKDLLLADLASKRVPLPSLYLLSDKLERGDSVGPYGKSLLYLVSNAFERSRQVPLLGMKAFLDTDQQLAKLFSGSVAGRPALVVSEGVPVDAAKDQEQIKRGASASRSHGGFDKDSATMNSVLTRVLDGVPKRLFTSRDLHF